MQNRQTFRLIENISSMTGNHFWKEGGQSFREKVLWLYVVELKDYDYFVWKLFLILFSSVFFFCCRVLAISGYYNNTRFDLTQDRSRTQEWRNNKKGWNSTVKLNLISRCCWQLHQKGGPSYLKAIFKKREKGALAIYSRIGVIRSISWHQFQFPSSTPETGKSYLNV